MCQPLKGSFRGSLTLSSLKELVAPFAQRMPPKRSNTLETYLFHSKTVASTFSDAFFREGCKKATKSICRQILPNYKSLICCSVINIEADGASFS